MLIKVSEATPLQLDWMVANCEGYEIVRMRGSEITFLDRTEDGALSERHINYSTDWSQGGPIIEREFIELTTTNRSNAEIWEAIFPGRGEDSVVQYGPTPLIAAMRCYVVAKWNDEVEIPEELK